MDGALSHRRWNELRDVGRCFFGNADEFEDGNWVHEATAMQIAVKQQDEARISTQSSPH